MPHPQLWPAIIGAIIGLALMVWASLWLVRRWDGLKHRWLIAAALGLIELGYWANIYAWFIEPNRLVIREVEIVSPHWQGAPLTIAAIADTHVGGPHVDAARIGAIVRRVNGLRPDLVVLLGDYVNGHAPEAARSGRAQQEILGGVAAFALLDAPLGAVAVIGNHDVWYDRASITQALQDAGIAALWNSHVVIPRAGGDVVILGLEDDMTSHPDFAAARDGARARRYAGALPFARSVRRCAAWRFRAHARRPRPLRAGEPPAHRPPDPAAAPSQLCVRPHSRERQCDVCFWRGRHKHLARALPQSAGDCDGENSQS
ncbi:MAG: metallophosphoesterase [Terricaulis sp.]|nr:metallophosphoesterase [Terricaulis sp.]